MNPNDIKKMNQQVNEAETKRAMQIAIAKSHVEWFERQSMVINRLVELLPHPGVQPGSMEHFEHRLKALCFACFGLAARFDVEFDKLIGFGKLYYDEAKSRLAATAEVQAAKPEEGVVSTLEQDRAERSETLEAAPATGAP